MKLDNEFATDLTSKDRNIALAAAKQYKLNRFNVCAEWINYRPVSLKDIINSGVLSNIPTIHRDYLDKK